MYVKGLLLGSIVAMLVMGTAMPAIASDDAETQALRAQLDLLKARLDKLEAQKTTAIQKEEMAKLMQEILDDAKAAPTLPAWMQDLKFYGYLRLRFDHLSRGWRDTGYGDHTRKDRNRVRAALRFGVTKTWWDKQLEVGFRLATGSDNGSTSINQTLGGGFSKKSVWIDLAYAKYAPNCIDGLTVIAGKMQNPVRTKTLLMWDSDINPEGFAVDYEAPFFGDAFKPYVQAAYVIISEASDGDDAAGRDVTMYLYSLGFNWKVTDDVKTFLGATYYQFDDVNAISSGYDGNWTGADYEVLEMTAKVGWTMFDLPWGVWGTWIHNCADDYEGQGVYDKLTNSNDAFGVGMTVGQNKKKGDWSAGYTYLYVEANSVPTFPAGFGTIDGDLGTTNIKGHIIGGAYNIDDFLTLGAKVIFTDPIHGIQGVNQGEDHSVLSRVEMIWKF